jgi:DNA-binding CsgD family transcriptional regulator
MSSASLSETFILNMKATPEIDATGVIQALGKAFGLADFTYFAEPSIAANLQEVEVYSSYSEAWLSRYTEKDYHQIDPVISTGMSGFLPFDWSTLSRKRKVVKNFFGEAADHGVHANGLSIPMRDPKIGRGLFSASFDVSDKEWKSYGPKIIGDVTYLAFLVHDTYNRNKNVVVADGHSEEQLSSVETDVLRWAGHGKTAWETGGIMGLSERGVIFHIRSACKKLNVTSKTHAVARCVSDGLFMVLPQ